MYDNYYEKEVSTEEIEKDLKAYLLWCIINKQTPEVSSMEEIDESTISHVRYHAELYYDTMKGKNLCLK